jgi:hypothetical protein
VWYFMLQTLPNFPCDAYCTNLKNSWKCQKGWSHQSKMAWMTVPSCPRSELHA